MAHYISTIPHSHKAQNLARTSSSYLIDGPIAKGGGGRGGGGRGGGGSSGGGSSGGGSGGGYTPGLPPIIIIPGSGGGYGSHGSSSGSTAPYDPSSSKEIGAIVGGVLGGIAALTFIFLYGRYLYKRRQNKRGKVEDAEAQDKEQGGAMMGSDGVAPFTLYPPPPPFTPTDLSATTHSAYIAAKSPLEYYKQDPSSSENLVSAATVIAPVPKKDGQQPVSSQSSLSTLHGADNGYGTSLKPVNPLAGAPLSSSSPRLVPTLTPYSQDQYQQPRITTQGSRRPFSPAISPITPTNPEGLRSYTPPPPSTPTTATNDFYDHLDVSSDSVPSVPPPAVAHAARPALTKSASSEKLAS
ncbi:hypothetical protein BGZ47_008239 [Haplosporangium gracile]|nr:hypothetical protein BGZ47_008239 [Haplosporangium gracile]